MSDSVILLVSIWLKDNDVAAFEAFERRVARIQARHGAKIERAIRLGTQDASTPFEVHIVRFPGAKELSAYRADPAIRELAAEREGIIGRTLIVEGHDVGPY